MAMELIMMLAMAMAISMGMRMMLMVTMMMRMMLMIKPGQASALESAVGSDVAWGKVRLSNTFLALSIQWKILAFPIQWKF